MYSVREAEGRIPIYIYTYDTCTESQMSKPGLAYRRALNDVEFWFCCDSSL